MQTDARNSTPLSSFLNQPLPELVILLVACITRFWRLGYHSIWFDEAVSLRWAGVKPFNIGLDYTIPATFLLVEEKHPPVYYTLLYGWRELISFFGLDQSDVTLRTLGVLLGIGTVLGVLLLVRHVSGRTASLWAGLFVALSPVLVWYSQELRMFQPAVTFIIWGLLGLIRAWRCDRLGGRLLWWLLMIIGFELALYSYLYSAFILPSAGICLVLLALQNQYVASPRFDIPIQQRRRRFIEGCIALAVVGGLFFPLAQNAWQINSNESTPGQAFANFTPQTLELFEIFTIWRENWSSPMDNIVMLALALLIVFGLAGPFLGRSTHRSDFTSPFLVICLLVGPWLLGNLLLASNRSVFKEDRYHIYLVPFVLWAIALGIVQLARIRSYLSWVVGVLVALTLLSILPRFWTPALLREDWRTTTEYIDQYQQQSPGLSSAGVAHINYTHLPMDWYLQQHYSFEELPIFGLFGEPLTAEMINDVIAPPLNGIVDYGAKTLWLTQSHLEGIDDERIVEAWLRENFPVITEQYPAGVKLTGFALQTEFDELPTLSDNALLLNAEMAPGITLAACEVMTPELSATDSRLHPPSGWVHMRLWWRLDSPAQNDYQLRAQVVDGSGIWGERLIHADELLAQRPMSQWPVSTFIRNELDVNMNPATPTGRYELRVGLVDKTSGDEVGSVSCQNVVIRD